jgi:hypothetical protein
VVVDRQRPDADRVMELAARCGEVRIGVADVLGADDPVRIAVRVGEDVPDRLGTGMNLRFVATRWPYPPGPSALPREAHARPVAITAR